MPTSSQKLAALLRAYRLPPPGLSDDWVRVFHALFDPASVAVNLGGSSHHSGRGSRELYVAWLNALRRSIESADVALQLIRVNSPRTWRTGLAIKSSIEPIATALASTIQYLANPYPTRNGQEATEISLRANIANLLDEFNPIPLLDELIAAVVADCTTQRSVPLTETIKGRTGGSWPRKANGPEKSERGKPKGTPLAEAEILVREWLNKNAKVNPGAVLRDGVAAETGVSRGNVSKSAAWKAFQEKRNAKKKPGVRELRLPESMQAILPAACVRPDEPSELFELIEAQAEDQRRQTRRHKPS
ncbi:MAG TPA: hypothetical protein VGJ05_20890 [Fimbriiglobus sp.]|jgi:hypothetical protein